MSHPIETMVGSVSRKNVITLTGGTPGPVFAHLHGPTQRWTLPVPLPPRGMSLDGATMPRPGTAHLCCSCRGPRTGSRRGISRTHRDPLSHSEMDAPMKDRTTENDRQHQGLKEKIGRRERWAGRKRDTKADIARGRKEETGRQKTREKVTRGHK